MNRSMTDTAPARTVRARGFVAQMHRTERAKLAEALERENMAEIERVAIAQRIRQAREEFGLSQPEMAEALQIHERTYQNYESETKPRTPWPLMNDIAKITGKPTEWLIHGARNTPDLIAGLSSGDQVNNGFDEFRGYVREILAKLDAGQLERAAIQDLLGEQAALLAELREGVKVLASLQLVVQAFEDAGLPVPGQRAAENDEAEWPGSERRRTERRHTG